MTPHIIAEPNTWRLDNITPENEDTQALFGTAELAPGPQLATSDRLSPREALRPAAAMADAELLDVATVSHTHVEPPVSMSRFNESELNKTMKTSYALMSAGFRNCKWYFERKHRKFCRRTSATELA